jgi:hypothetical protein
VHYYNGISAAKRIDISYKTLLRYIEKGRIVPEEAKTPTGQLVIGEDQVESLRLEIQKERDMFLRPQSGTVDSRHQWTPRESQGVPLTDTTLNEALKHIGKLQARVDVQDARIAELERRMSTFEQSSPSAPTDTIGQPEHVSPYDLIDTTAPSRISTTVQSRTIDEEDHEPSLRVSTLPTPPIDIPAGSLLMADFAQLHNVNRSTMWRHCIQGIQGDRILTIELPKPGGRKGDKERWLSPEQQEEALHFWIRQKVKYYLCGRTECACNILRSSTE